MTHVIVMELFEKGMREKGRDILLFLHLFHPAAFRIGLVLHVLR